MPARRKRRVETSGGLSSLRRLSGLGLAAAWRPPSAWPAWRPVGGCRGFVGGLGCARPAWRWRAWPAGLASASASALVGWLVRLGRGIAASLPRRAFFAARALRLLVGVGRHRGDQRRRRSGSGRYRPGSARRPRARPPAIPTASWHRRLQARRRKTRVPAECRWSAVAGDRRPRPRRWPALVMLAAAHLVAQVRRRGIDRHQIVDGAERGSQPRQRIAGEAALEHLRGAHRAHLAGRSAEHHRDQPLAVARRGAPPDCSRTRR